MSNIYWNIIDFSLLLFCKWKIWRTRPRKFKIKSFSREIKIIIIITTELGILKGYCTWVVGTIVRQASRLCLWTFGKAEKEQPTETKEGRYLSFYSNFSFSNVFSFLIVLCCFALIFFFFLEYSFFPPFDLVLVSFYLFLILIWVNFFQFFLFLDWV